MKTLMFLTTLSFLSAQASFARELREGPVKACHHCCDHCPDCGGDCGNDCGCDHC